MDSETLKQVLADHAEWLKDSTTGKRADLRYSNLRGSDLSGSDLSGSDLSGSNLRYSNLRYSDLSGSTILPTGESWKQYLSETLPALCIAGGVPLDKVATPEHWECHSWGNCPMSAAFGATTLDDVPILLRPRAEQFVQLFDAGLIPMPETSKEVVP